MAKFSEKFFCPAPWAHLYYQINSPSPCHIIRNNHLNMTPNEYVNSDWLRRIKTDMIAGIVPLECSNCRTKESLGLKSTRGAMWAYDNTGPEPEYENQWFYDKFTATSPTYPRRIEVRFSNLCNMKCRMCDETSSSEWAKEKNEFDIPPSETCNPGGLLDTKTSSIIKITEDKIAGLKNKDLLRDLERVCFTGGEPFIIKEYYDYLDFLIESEMSSKLSIELFTNCSVYNPLFISRLEKFSSVDMVLSLDGVGKTAEYIRHGTDWGTIEQNVMSIIGLKKPFNSHITIAISAYTLLDISSLAEFLMKVYENNNNIGIKCYTVLMHELKFQHTPKHLRLRMVLEINKALKILKVSNYSALINELKNIRANIIRHLNDPNPGKVKLFYEFTEKIDKIRNESFEKTFGLSLYPPKN